ncbi:MAG: FadR/GntR family transcriptional regulator [Eubacteriales bacterium]|nr:FadR/GntR family transcriptional regulator [Eubacteriales bacterium]
MQARLPDYVADQIRDYIIGETIKAGERLPTEKELSDKFLVSRSTIREAMKILEAGNIVEIRHGLGSFVALNTGLSKDPLGLSFADQSRLLPELMEVRLILEPNIAKIAAVRRTEEDIAIMSKLISEMEMAVEQGGDYHAKDYQFHIAIGQCLKNDVLKRVYPVIFEAIEHGYKHTSNLQGSFSRAIYFHKQILNAIKDKNADLAGEFIEQHIKNTMLDIEKNTKGARK